MVAASVFAVGNQGRLGSLDDGVILGVNLHQSTDLCALFQQLEHGIVVGVKTGFFVGGIDLETGHSHLDHRAQLVELTQADVHDVAMEPIVYTHVAIRLGAAIFD